MNPLRWISKISTVHLSFSSSCLFSHAYTQVFLPLISRSFFPISLSLFYSLFFTLSLSLAHTIFTSVHSVRILNTHPIRKRGNSPKIIMDAREISLTSYFRNIEWFINLLHYDVEFEFRMPSKSNNSIKITRVNIWQTLLVVHNNEILSLSRIPGFPIRTRTPPSWLFNVLTSRASVT